jgi:hypothetical protein
VSGMSPFDVCPLKPFIKSTVVTKNQPCLLRLGELLLSLSWEACMNCDVLGCPISDTPPLSWLLQYSSCTMNTSGSLFSDY